MFCFSLSLSLFSQSYSLSFCRVHSLKRHIFITAAETMAVAATAVILKRKTKKWATKYREWMRSNAWLFTLSSSLIAFSACWLFLSLFILLFFFRSCMFPFRPTVNATTISEFDVFCSICCCRWHSYNISLFRYVQSQIWVNIFLVQPWSRVQEKWFSYFEFMAYSLSWANKQTKMKEQQKFFLSHESLWCIQTQNAQQFDHLFKKSIKFYSFDHVLVSVC